jgi:DNA replication protein DnaC
MSEKSFTMPDLQKVGEWTDKDVADFTAAYRRKRERKNVVEYPTENTYCKRCGGAKGSIIYGASRRRCDCTRRFNEARLAIRRVDPQGEMTFAALKDAHPTVQSTAPKLKSIVGGREHGVFMFGLPGRGKTHLSIATARALLDKERLVGVYNLAGLVGRVQSTYGYDDASESRSKIIEDVCMNDVVILDDIGKEHKSSNVESIIYELIDGLYNARVTLIASSNLPGKDFVQRYDGAVLSRLGGMCEKVVIKGEDRRASKWEW